ncbi:MAG: protein kinase [Deltaproteobacteria bacterium]|nr:protein kinase [Deltaproteobacteria bacterium]
MALTSSADLSSGTVIGNRFEIVDELGGSSALGPLYRCRDQQSGDDVSLRLLAPRLCRSEVVVEKLRSETRTASELSHKNLVRALGMGRAGTHRFVAAEWIEGNSLRQLLERKRRAGRMFSYKSVYNILAHVCNALRHLHQKMPHTLPGPGAIFVSDIGRVKLGRIGLLNALPTESLLQLSDAYALAPELRHTPAEHSPAADIYTLGILLEEMLTGRRPDEQAAEAVDALPSPLRAVISCCTDRDPGSRFADPQQLKAAFYAALQRLDQTGGPPAPPREVDDFEPSTEVSDRDAAPAASAPIVRQASPAPRQPTTGRPVEPPPRPVTDPAVPKGAENVEALLAIADGDTDQRYLVQKSGVDFGPYTMGNLKRALQKGDISGDDLLIDQETGQRVILRHYPVLTEFIRHAEHQLAAQKQQALAFESKARDRRRRTVLMTVLTVAVLLLAGGGVILALHLTKKPSVKERIVYRDRQALPTLKGIDVQWRAEPADQAKHRRLLTKRRRKRGGSASDPSEHVTRLGDATKAGGDELLSQSAVEKVMQSNFSKLTGCVQSEWRRNRALDTVEIVFGIAGTGNVKSVKVNDKNSGPFHGCIAKRMATIGFPKFDGTLTWARFSMRLKR